MLSPRKIKGHWREIDYRHFPLVITFEGLKNSILSLIKSSQEVGWYDAACLKEDLEPIYGLVFIALQNYINSSIYDFDESLHDKLKFYKCADEVKDGVTNIELIICLANYFKHRDDSRELHKGTAQTLDKLKLLYDEDCGVDNSPIFAGLTILNKDWELDSLIEIVKKWREKLWHDFAI